MNAVRSTAWKLVRPAAASAHAQHRTMAIAATVKKAPDTSATDFPAPSHVTLSTQLAEVAEDIAHFYSNPDSKIDLPDAVKAEVRDEIERRSKGMLTELDESTSPTAHIDIPDTFKLRDSPLFKRAK